MHPGTCALRLLCLLLVSLPLAAQTPGTPSAARATDQRGAPAADPYLPRPTGLAGADLSALRSDLATLGDQIASLKRAHSRGPEYDRIADVEVFWSAVHNQIEHNERTDLTRAKRALQVGFDRAAKLAQGQTPWMAENGIRGFYSRIDGSAQPYILNVPVDFEPDNKQLRRLDVFLHGRDEGTYDLNFMFTKSTTNFNNMPLNPELDRFILQPFGRYSNASRFAGETDVLEAIDSVKQAYRIDENRIVMTGFSMGGASAWQFAVHYADRWAASSAGAGFTETEQFLRLNSRNMHPEYQRTLWHMYDVKDYAINTFNSPTIAYSGETDPQKQAADVMDASIAAEGLTLERMIGPKTGHMYEPATRLKLIARLDELATKGRNAAPAEVRFTTWMLRYHRMYWIDIDGMQKHWERARVTASVDGQRVTVATVNVSALHLDWVTGLAPAGPGTKLQLEIDGTRIQLPAVRADLSLNVGLIKAGAKWRIGTLPAGLNKTPGLQGPIDDAFMDSFMIVRPTGPAFSEALGEWEKAQLAYAISEWQGVFRGEPRIKDDSAITAADIAAHNLVLFGDPSSNAIYKRIAAKLPVQWTPSGVVAGGQTFPADVHAPVMIFPNPLNPQKYVVINTGFTFHDQSNNDLQSPKLPDWAIVNITEPGNRQLPLSVQAQGFFDEHWRLQR